ncbi:TonB-dependent receptor [Pedobacter nyackensis]|uniref:TonB-dependent receptor n=1 Tax=Pedobacter nyackensis TaxID=475255 RepID=UPI0029303D24|nr:carboxypeptidase-like regulatory domain-containing protein [Pedobacter nyackensis]
MKVKLLFLLISFVISLGSLSAQVIKGTIKNSATQEGVGAVSIHVKNSSEGTYSDDRGRFQLTVKKKFPIVLILSSIGFETKEVSVESSTTGLDISLNPTSILGQEVVVSASRMAQKKLASPVTIEQISSKDITNAPQLNYMDMIQGLRGVDVTVSSLGFTSISTRGFNTSGNTNFTQIVDGMDNQAPGLNFPLGSAISLTQLDVDNIEMLSGASSALYGSRGLNGTMVMTGKDPFKYQGLSVLVTQGVNHIKNGKDYDPVGPSPYYDWTIRYAKKINEKLAFKVNGQYTRANDWVASDATNKYGPGTALTDPGYVGVNYYGGATRENINPFLEAALGGMPELEPIIGPLLQKPNYVARTGYPEYGYLDNRAQLLKVNAELKYKINSNLEAIVSGTYGTGNIVYTNDTRYQLKDFKVGQYRAELRSDNWFVRAYTTSENSGRTIIAGPTAQLINEGWKVSYDGGTGGWYPEYTSALIEALAGGTPLNDAHLAARAFADQGRPELGTPQFNALKDKISNTPISEGGTLFLDRSKLYNAEAQYNFTKHVKFMNVIAGANWRLYNLNSKNTLFPDKGKPINVKEYSAYVQMAKKVAADRLNLSTSFRYDKNTLFSSPKVTSRASAVYEPVKENFIRFSYQNAYSFPSNIQALQSTLNGTNSYSSGGSSLLLNGTYEFDKYPPYELESVHKFQESQNPDDLKRFEYNDIKPQSVNAFELGYAALIAKRVMFDVLGYYSTWKNFIGYANVANTPGSNDVNKFLEPNHAGYNQYNIAFNGGQTVNTYGYAASVSVDLTHNFMAKVNYFSDHIDNKNSKQIDNFNTPNYHINFDFGNSGFGKKQEWSFGTSMRYKPGYHYVVSGGLASGQVPSSMVIDAQVSYKLIKARSGIRLGATNITNKYYSTGVANPNIGAVYYVTYAYNIF